MSDDLIARLLGPLPTEAPRTQLSGLLRPLSEKPPPVDLTEVRAERAEAATALAEQRAEIERLRAGGAAALEEIDTLARIVFDICKELDCAHDNEAALIAVAALRARLAKAEGALQGAVKAMEGVSIFVTSKTRIKYPEGEDWWRDQIADARAALVATKEKNDGL